MIYRIPATKIRPDNDDIRPLQKYIIVLGFNRNTPTSVLTWHKTIYAKDGFEAYEMALNWIKKEHENNPKECTLIKESMIDFKKVFSIDDFYISPLQKEELETKGPHVP